MVRGRYNKPFNNRLQLIMALLAERGTMMPKQVTEATGLSGSYVDDLLLRLLNAGLVVRVAAGYRLSPQVCMKVGEVNVVAAAQDHS